MSDEKKHSVWWYIKEGAIQAASFAVAFAPEIINSLTQANIVGDWTLLSKLSIPISVVWRGAKVKEWYQKNMLPKLATVLLDKVPDKITGERNREDELPSGLSNEKSK